MALTPSEKIRLAQKVIDLLEGEGLTPREINAISGIVTDVTYEESHLSAIADTARDAMDAVLDRLKALPHSPAGPEGFESDLLSPSNLAEKFRAEHPAVLSRSPLDSGSCTTGGPDVPEDSASASGDEASPNTSL
jgi:hypothetical protein